MTAEHTKTYFTIFALFCVRFLLLFTKMTERGSNVAKKFILVHEKFEKALDFARLLWYTVNINFII